MRRVIGIALLAIALMLGNLTLTSANASDDDDVIRLLAKTVVDEYLDLGPTGESFGDQLVFSDDLYLDGDLVGTLDGSCTFTRVVVNVSAMVNCSVTLTLPDGQITLQGAISFDENTDRFTVAITGGTGDYNEAQGQVKVRFINDTDTKLKVMLD
jgi:hypothetical protein